MARLPTLRISLAILLMVIAAACDGDPADPPADGVDRAAAVLPTGAWSLAINVESIPGTSPLFNTPALDGCPFVSRDGRTFFMASTRTGGIGGIDIWMATRGHPDDPWGDPINVGPPVNSEHNDFCPTLARDGHRFFFVSTRPGGCGGADIYVSRMHDDHTFESPGNLGCEVNSPADEQSPFPLPQSTTGPVLYFSSFRPGGFAPDPPGATTGDSDLYMSEWHGGAFGPAQLVPGVNSAANDAQPNVSRNGLELYFFSTRPGTLGGPDIYVASRARTSHPWSLPVNLGPAVNSPAAESRPSLSWDGTTLYFGSNRPDSEGDSDIYVAWRSR